MILADSTRMDTERAMRPEIEDNWPTSVTLAGERFEVAYGVNSQDEIAAFSLIDSEENELLQCDIAVIYLLAEHFPEIIIVEHSERFKSERERELYRAIEAEHYGRSPESKEPNIAREDPASATSYSDLFPSTASPRRPPWRIASGSSVSSWSPDQKETDSTMTAAEQKSLREISKELAGRDRSERSALIARRRRALLTQLAMDSALGLPSGSIAELESYDSDPTLSELRRYEALIMLAEQGPEALASLLSEHEIDILVIGLLGGTVLDPERLKRVRALVAVLRPDSYAKIQREQG